MRVLVCGVRGSTPSPGPEYVRYGGHTSCVAVAHDGQEPTLVLDAGTGLRRLTAALGGRPFRGAILLGHLHWDHTQGLPFFRSGDHPDADVDLYLPAQDADPEELLARAMAPPHFPVRPAQLRGRWRFHGLDEGEHVIAGFRVLAREIPHKGGRTFGYRVSDGATTLAYLSDHCPTALGSGPRDVGAEHDAARALADGVDLLFHDAQYTAAELPVRAAFGHAAAEYAVGLAETCQVGRLLLFHHDPDRVDEEIDALVAAAADAAVPVVAAAEGAVLDLAAVHRR